MAKSPLVNKTVAHWFTTCLAGVALPDGWPGSLHDGDADSTAALLATRLLWSLATETATLDVAFSGMVCGGRSVRTLAKYRLQFLKLALWLALRGFAFDPPLLRAVSHTSSSSPRSGGTHRPPARRLRRRRAAVHPLAQRLAGRERQNCLRVAIDAASHASAAQTREAPAIEAWMFVVIVQAFCGTNEPAPRRMFGYAVLAFFMVVGRSDDLCRIRFDPGFFEVPDTHLQFFFGHHKSDQNCAGHWVDVATAGASSAKSRRLDFGHPFPYRIEHWLQSPIWGEFGELGTEIRAFYVFGTGPLGGGAPGSPQTQKAGPQVPKIGTPKIATRFGFESL